MSKRFKNHDCVYCGQAGASTADHVLARQFFLDEHRSGLPKVPACTACNNTKSQLEHYLTTLLPFGGRHPKSTRMLTELVPPRLAKNRTLHGTLRSSMTPMWADQGGYAVRTTGIPMDGDKLLRLMHFVVRGLLWHHWQVRLEPDDQVNVYALASAGVEYFDGIFARNAAQRVRANLGEGTFVYEGAQGIDVPQVTAWRIAAYGGMQFADPERPSALCSVFGALTGPKRASETSASLRPPSGTL